MAPSIHASGKCAGTLGGPDQPRGRGPLLMRRLRCVVFFMWACGCLAAQDVTFRGRVDVVHRSKHRSGSSEVVVWLTPAQPQVAPPPEPLARLIQKDKRFSPHVIAVRVGSEIDFPNRDPFF